MGCILACLRLKVDKKKNKAQLKSSPVPSKSKEPLLANEQFVSLFITEGSSCERALDLNYEESSDQDILERELRDEAEFLKSCGTILETPAELRKASAKVTSQSPNNDIISNDSSMCLNNLPTKKLALDELHEDANLSQNNHASIKFGENEALRHNDCLLPPPSEEETQIKRHGSNVSVWLESGKNSIESSEDSISLNASSEELLMASAKVTTQLPSNDMTSPKVTIQLPSNDMASSSSKSCPSVMPVLSLIDEQPGDSNLLQNNQASFKFGEREAHRRDAYDHVLLSPFENDTGIKPHGTYESAYFESAKNYPNCESRAELAPLNPSPFQGKVFLEYDKHSSMLDISPTQDGTQIQQFAFKHSPYPTPLKLTEEMETPLTVYPSTHENIRRKDTQIRTQYAYPVLNPIENNSQLREKDIQKDKRSPNREEFEKENFDFGRSFNELMKLLPGDDEKNHIENNKIRRSCLDRTPIVEKPIFGGVALHWNEDDESKETPKLWGGNGIPNTTTKYKEDQKVSWHATPFEERLDKALSDEKLLPRRQDIARNLAGIIAEGEESDTTLY